MDTKRCRILRVFIFSGLVVLAACDNFQVATTPDESDALKKIRSGQFELVAKTELAQLRKDAEIARASVERNADTAELSRCLQIQNGDTRMGPSSSRIISGDVRPLWRISGRVQNTCGLAFADIVFDIHVSSKDGSESLDSDELTLKGTLAPYSTRGFVQEVQLRIEQQGWNWNMSPSRAKIIP